MQNDDWITDEVLMQHSVDSLRREVKKLEERVKFLDNKMELFYKVLFIKGIDCNLWDAEDEKNYVRLHG